MTLTEENLTELIEWGENVAKLKTMPRVPAELPELIVASATAALEKIMAGRQWRTVLVNKKTGEQAWPEEAAMLQDAFVDVEQFPASDAAEDYPLDEWACVVQWRSPDVNGGDWNDHGTTQA